MLWSVAIQCVLVIAFTIILVWQVRNLGVNTLVDNLNASAAAYARSAEFAFITNSDSERQRIVSEAVVSSTNVGALILSPSGETIASAFTDDLNVPDALLHQIAPVTAPTILGDEQYQVFVHPVYLSREETGELGALVDDAEPELLGFYALIGSKVVINNLQREIVAIAALGAFLLLGVLLVVNAALATFLLKPMERLVAETKRIDASETDMRVKSKGPVEVTVLAEALNGLLARLEEVRTGLNMAVAEKTKEERAQRRRAEVALNVAEEARHIAEKLRDNRARIMTANTHDLLTPLRLIINQVERLQEHLQFMPASESRDAAIGDAARISKHIGQIEELVDDINESLRIEATPIDYEDKTLERLRAVLSETFTPVAAANGNTLTIDVDDAIIVRTDHRKLGTICRNLLSNACKFTRQGKICFSVRVKDDCITIVCRDTGVGIAEDMVTLIYDAFQRGDMSATRIADGLGLGLTILQGFVERLGGDISCDSTLGAGTTFTVRLPIGQESEASQQSR